MLEQQDRASRVKEKTFYQRHFGIFQSNYLSRHPRKDQADKCYSLLSRVCFSIGLEDKCRVSTRPGNADIFCCYITNHSVSAWRQPNGKFLATVLLPPQVSYWQQFLYLVEWSKTGSKTRQVYAENESTCDKCAMWPFSYCVCKFG